MNIQQYRQETLRTLPDLGSKKLNSLHMTLGILTEIGEIAEATSKRGELDMINLREEIADIMWYLANYANIHALEFPEILLSGIVDNEDWSFGQIIAHADKLADFDKKLLAYGKVSDQNVYAPVFESLYYYIHLFCYTYSIDLEYAMELNIAKLKARYPDKFSADKANNRDLETERLILIGQQ